MEEIFCNKLKNDLLPLYNQVKAAIILAENLNEEREMYIAPINQLRSALDHIFKATSTIAEAENCDYELKEAKEHMARAGYDALELLAGSLGTNIIRKLQPYDTQTLTQIFPIYFSSIKPEITQIQQSIAEKRMERKTDLNQSFCAYFDEIKELVEIDKAVNKMIPSLQEYADKKKREKRNDKLWKIVIGLVSVVVGYLLSKIKWGVY